MIKIWIDGSAKPNPGKAGIGIVIRSDNWDYDISEKIDSKDKVSGNQGEYMALCRALEELLKNNVKEPVEIFSDSQLLVWQMTDKISVGRGDEYANEFQRAKILQRYFNSICYHYIPREENAEANILASKAVRS